MTFWRLALTPTLPSPLTLTLSPERRSHQANPVAHLTGKGGPRVLAGGGDGSGVSWGDQTDTQPVRAVIVRSFSVCSGLPGTQARPRSARL